MKSKKILIIIVIIILIALIFIQVNLGRKKTSTKSVSNTQINNANVDNSNLISNTTNTNKEINTFVNTEAKRVFVMCEDDLFKTYNQNIDNSEFEEYIYKLAFETIPQIKQNSTEDISQNISYYNNNKEYYSSNGITSEEDYILIANDIYFIGKNNDAAFLEANLDYNNIVTENDYTSFPLELYYSNEQCIKLKCYLANSSELEPQIKFSSNSAIQQLYDVVGENSFDRIEATKTINKFLNNAKTLEENIVRKTYNQISEYYSQNTSYINSLGIYSSDDLININKNLNKINWNNSVSFSLYSIDTDTSLTQDDYYVNATLLVPYDTNNNLEITISVAKASNIQPQIKIS